MTENSMPVWKKIYPIISGSNRNITDDVVKEMLKLCNDKLVTGLLDYKHYKKSSYDVWRRESKGIPLFEDEEMCKFIHLLSMKLNLEVGIAWSVMCNFLLFEYYGKVDELKSIIKFETNSKCLIDNIWYFYTRDRLFLLKTLRQILEKQDDREYIFYEQFTHFMKSINIDDLWRNLIKVLEDLLKEISKETCELTNDLEQWVHRNNSEQREVLMLLILVTEHRNLNGKEFSEILNIFMHHGFGRHPFLQEAMLMSRKEDILQIKYAEIGCIIAIAYRYWTTPGKYEPLSDIMEKTLELMQLQSDHSIILFLWSVLKISVANGSLNYCTNVVTALLENHLFQNLYDFVSNELFMNCKAGFLVIQGTCQLMFEFCQICVDQKFLYEQDGVMDVLKIFMRYSSLDARNKFKELYRLAIEMFPHDLKSFLNIFIELVKQEEHFDYVVHTIQNLQTHLIEIPWTFRSTTSTLGEDSSLYLRSDYFFIPKGTKSELYIYKNRRISLVHAPFSFYTLIQQHINSIIIYSLSGFVKESLKDFLIFAFKLIIEIVKNYKENFALDTPLKVCINSLDCIPAQFSDGLLRSFELMKLYFTVKSTAIMEGKMDFNEAFPMLIQKKFLPNLACFNKSIKHLFAAMQDTATGMLSCLLEEESLDDHSLLLQYIHFVHNLIQRNILHSEIQAPGVWYIINVVFPHHGQWAYKDKHQQDEICKGCFEVFVEILQNDPTTENDLQREIFEFCRDSFLKEDWVIKSFLTTFIKDRYFLQNAMTQESNWICGPNLMKLEIIKLQLVLLLLILKYKSGYQYENKCAVDEYMNVIAKGVSRLIVNCYSNAITKLACRFLEVLARDDNIPLMALLELDYDQIQRLFLDTLRDSMEDEDIKVHIVELINTCITHQHGMTAAMFNVQCSRKWYSDTYKRKDLPGDTVTDFMIDYLQNIRKSHEFLKNPLQLGILRVMSTLWLTGKNHLIKDVIALEAFWPLLANPMFKKFDQYCKVYAYLLKIFAVEIFSKGPRNDNNFRTIIEKFFQDKPQLKLWFEYIITLFESLPADHNDFLDLTDLLKTWMQFLLVTNDSYPYFFDAETKYLFTKNSLNGLKVQMGDLRVLHLWGETFMLTIAKWNGCHIGKEYSVMEEIITVFGSIKIYYPKMPRQTRQVFLCAIEKILVNFKKHLENHSIQVTEFLESVGLFIDYEYNTLENEVWQEYQKDIDFGNHLVLPWVIIVKILNNLLKYENVEACSVWFHFYSILPKLINCTTNFMKYPKSFPLGRFSIYCLTSYVKSNIASDFLSLNLVNLFDHVEPPIRNIVAAHHHKLHPLKLREAFVTCTVVMKFAQALINRFQFSALKCIFKFFTIFEFLMKYAMSIPDVSVDLNALNFLTETLVLLDDFLTYWSIEWYRKANDTFNSIMLAIQRLINSCITDILRPKNLCFYILDQNDMLVQLENVPSEVMVAIMNKLIHIISLAFSCLYKINPDMIKMISGDFDIASTFILIETDFAVPKFELPITHNLTYGRILCLAHFLCKTLDQLQRQSTIKTKSIPKDAYTKYERHIGLVENQRVSENLPNQKLSAFLQYAMYKYSGLSDTWITQLSVCNVGNALEKLMLFLASQTFLTVNTIDKGSLSYYERNLCSELQFFYEYVKKRTSDLLNRQLPSPTKYFVKSPIKTDTYIKSEVDMFRRYMVMCHRRKCSDEIVDEHFFLIISLWFSSICNLH